MPALAPPHSQMSPLGDRLLVKPKEVEQVCCSVGFTDNFLLPLMFS